jgi:carbamoyltransferase
MKRSLIKYHPTVAFTLLPNVKTRVEWETGGYLVRTNSAGFRADREFVKEKTPGVFRALLFGDSQTEGDGTSNGERYSDFLEKIIPNLEVYNYGLPGTGTDQHYLVYQECAKVDHDLVIVGMYVENIGRVAHRYFPYLDDAGNETIHAKPYYTLDENRELVLHHVPVRKEPIPRESFTPEESAHIYQGVRFAGIRNVVKKLGLRDLMQKVVKFQPLPDYDSPENSNWILLRAILEKWIQVSEVPVLLVLLPMWPYIEESSDPTNYQTRFQELARDAGCALHDPLADLWKYSAADRRAFRFAHDSHYTPSGHRAIAESIAPTIKSIMDRRQSGVSQSDPDNHRK